MEFEICLKDLRFYAYHGVFEEERKTGNEFKVDLSVFTPYDDNIRSDDLSKTVSYANLFNIIKEEMSIPRNLLEKVAIEIALKIKRDFPVIQRGRINIEKIHPPIPGMIGSAAIALNF